MLVSVKKEGSVDVTTRNRGQGIVALYDIGAFAWLSWQAMVCSLELPRIWAYFAPAEPGGTGNCIRVGRRPEQDTRRCEAGLDREMLGARL